ncbi:hypothetical protein S83_069177 [Arachis hypogaea]
MKTLSLAYLLLVFLTFSAFKFNPSNAKQTHPISDNNMLNTIDHLLDRIYQWRNEAQESQTFVSWLMVLAGVLCFIASSISSAGGIGGGGLFIPILTIVAGLDLKTASSLSAFMVTGGSIANVMCNLCRKSTKLGKKSLIDYDIALLSEPCMLLGVSVGVICNLVFPEWLITALFAVFLAWCTSKTCNCAMRFWRNESEEMRKKFGLAEKLEKGQPGNEIGTTEENKENEGSKSIEEPLLVPEVNSNETPLVEIGGLVFGLVLLLFCLSSSRQQIWTEHHSNGAMWIRILDSVISSSTTCCGFHSLDCIWERETSRPTRVSRPDEK